MVRPPLKTIFLTIVTAVITPGFSIQAWAESTTAVLAIGHTVDWPARRSLQVSVSNGAVVHVVDRGDKLKIIGKKIGVARVRAGETQITIHVVRHPVRRLYDRLNEIVQTSRGLELDIENSVISVRGRLLRFEDWVRLSRAAIGSEAKYSFQASLNSDLATRANGHINQLLRLAHTPELPLEFNPEATVIVSTEPADLRGRVERLLAPYGFRVTVSPSALALEPMVRVRLIVAEFRKDVLSRIGINWPGAVAARLLPTPLFPSSPELNLSVNALEQNGFGKILASPTLLCRSGKDAQFLAGGEIPIKVANHKSHEVTWKKYGILLRIRPKADFSGRMSIGIETEVSMLGGPIVDGIPGLLTNRIESHFDLTSSRTIVLSGLIKKEMHEATDGLPLLARIPIIGALFGSRDYAENRTELVVFVTPELARPDTENP